MCVLTVKAKRASLVMSQCHGNTEDRLRLFDDSPGHQKCPSSLGMPKASETSKSSSSLKTCTEETQEHKYSYTQCSFKLYTVYGVRSEMPYVCMYVTYISLSFFRLSKDVCKVILKLDMKLDFQFEIKLHHLNARSVFHLL